MTLLDLPGLTGLLMSNENLHAGSRMQTLVKGEHIFQQGDVCRDIFCLTSGLVKLYYLTYEGKEWIKSFVADQGMFGSRTCQALGAPSPFSVQCLESTQVLRVPYPLFEAACLGQPELALKLFNFSQWLGLRKEQREHELLCLNAEQRYQRFLYEHRALLGRITQIDIARYLGITPIALSRIKKRFDSKTPRTV